MTLDRAAGPGPRTAALHRVTSPGSGSRRPRAGLARTARSLLIGLGVALLLGACGPATVRPSAPASAPTIGLPNASGPPVAAGSPAPGDSRPRWPGTTVLAVIALGAADGEIQKAGADLQAAAEKQDLKAMWGAADGLAKMIDALMPNLDRLEAYAGTTDVSRLYRKAFPELSAGAKQLRDSITGGDSAGVVAGSQMIAKGLADYAPVRRLIGGLVEEALLQQRLLVR
jgi:hypothetical protein